MKRNSLLLFSVSIVIIVALAFILVFKKNFFPGLLDMYCLKNSSKEDVYSSYSKAGDIYGIDVSHHQGDIQWNKVKDWKGKKIDFVYLKATEGATYVDKTYKKNLKEVRNSNLLVGSYHYFRTTSSVNAQFKNFIKNVDKDQQDLIPLVDVEEKKNWTKAEFHQNFQEFLDLVENHFGTKPMIYTVNSFYNIYLSGRYKSYHFLIGRYGKIPPNMKDKSSWTIWQFTEKGKVNGIQKYVDIDVMNHQFGINDLLLEK